jgi:hypothetical protein
MKPGKKIKVYSPLMKKNEFYIKIINKKLYT